MTFDNLITLKVEKVEKDEEQFIIMLFICFGNYNMRILDKERVLAISDLYEAFG